MKHLNRVELVGTAGSVRTAGGMTRLSVATCHSFVSGGCPVVETTWHSVLFPGECEISMGDPV